MKIYQVYNCMNGNTAYFSTRKLAKFFIEEVIVMEGYDPEDKDEFHINRITVDSMKWE